MNSNWNSLEGVEQHLLIIGTSIYYTEWVYHGQPVTFNRDTKKLDDGTSSNPFNEGTSSSHFCQ